MLVSMEAVFLSFQKTLVSATPWLKRSSLLVFLDDVKAPAFICQHITPAASTNVNFAVANLLLKDFRHCCNFAKGRCRCCEKGANDYAAHPSDKAIQG